MQKDKEAGFERRKKHCTVDLARKINSQIGSVCGHA
jgi:hypothetical protein